MPDVQTKCLDQTAERIEEERVLFWSYCFLRERERARKVVVKQFRFLKMFWVVLIAIIATSQFSEREQYYRI